MKFIIELSPVAGLCNNLYLKIFTVTNVNYTVHGLRSDSRISYFFCNPILTYLYLTNVSFTFWPNMSNFSNVIHGAFIGCDIPSATIAEFLYGCNSLQTLKFMHSVRSIPMDALRTLTQLQKISLACPTLPYIPNLNLDVINSSLDVTQYKKIRVALDFCFETLPVPDMGVFRSAFNTTTNLSHSNFSIACYFTYQIICGYYFNINTLIDLISPPVMLVCACYRNYIVVGCNSLNTATINTTTIQTIQNSSTVSGSIVSIVIGILSSIGGVFVVIWGLFVWKRRRQRDFAALLFRTANDLFKSKYQHFVSDEMSCSFSFEEKRCSMRSLKLEGNILDRVQCGTISRENVKLAVAVACTKGTTITEQSRRLLEAMVFFPCIFSYFLIYSM